MQQLIYRARLFFSSPPVRDKVLAFRLRGKNPFSENIQQQKQERMGIIGIRECMRRIKYVRKMRKLRGLDIREPDEIAVTPYRYSPREDAYRESVYEELGLTAEIARRYARLGELMEGTNRTLSSSYYVRAIDYEIVCIELAKAMEDSHLALEHLSNAYRSRANSLTDLKDASARKRINALTFKLNEESAALNSPIGVGRRKYPCILNRPPDWTPPWKEGEIQDPQKFGCKLQE